MEVSAAGGEYARQHQGSVRPDLPAGRSRSNLFMKSPGHSAGNSRHRGIDFRRRTHQRDPAVLARAVYRRPPRPICAGLSGASQPSWIRASPRWPRCSSAAGTRRSRIVRGIAQPARHHHSPDGSTARTTNFMQHPAGTPCSKPEHARSGCCGPAPDQGCCGFRYPVRGGPRRPGYDQYPAGERCGLSPTWASSGDRWPRMMPRRNRHWRVLRAPDVTPMLCVRNCSAKALSRSVHC